jgi:hypothetical protein
VGSSHINSAIDPAYVQQKLSEHLGHPANVVSLCWGGPGLDFNYFVTRDLLERRKVRLIVFYDDLGRDAPAEQIWRIISWSDARAALAGLPWSKQLAYYYGGIFSLPRAIFNRLVPVQAANLSATEKRAIQQMEFHPPDAWLNLPAPAKPDGAPSITARPEQVLIYGPASAAPFDFSGPEAAPLQVYFARKFLDVAQKSGSSLACLSIPVLADCHDAAVPAGRLWPEVFQDKAALVGIPPAEFFAGLSDAQVQSLYRNPTHLNAAGEALFTQIVTPRLLDLYDKTQP